MCGIFGFSHINKYSPFIVQDIIKDLLVLSESRGKEASGIAILQNNDLDVFRTSKKASELVNLREYNEFVQRLTRRHEFIMGNTRLATNGSAYKAYNNQPVVTKDSIGIHNGMIVNETRLWKKYPSLKREYDVDTEVILKLVELFIKQGNTLEEAISVVYKEIQGAASLAVMNTSSSTVVVTTNTGSVYYVYDGSLFLFASEEYIVKKVLGNHVNVQQLIPRCGISFNYNTFALAEFVLEKPIKKRTNKVEKKFFSIHLHEIKIKTFEKVEDVYNNNLKNIQNHVPDYDAIEKLRRCTRCILPETMPLISFDKDGVCIFCKTTKKINYQGKDALIHEIARYKEKIKGTKCIVALSGGRDSSFGLHYMKNVLGMNPIAYTYDWGMVTDIARRNQYRLTAEMGVEHIIVSADINKKRENIKKNVEAWLRRPNLAMIPLFMAGDKQAEYFAEQVKHQTGRKLMIYCRGNELEDERFKFGYYGIFDGTPGGVLHNLSLLGKVQMASYYAREYILNPSYINSSLVDTAFAYFSAYLMNHKDFLYLWHYIPWDEKEIISTLKGKYGWESPSDTIATWRIDDGTPPFYNYIYYKVQGFTEHDGLRSNQIRQGIITRKEALRLVKEENKPRYEALKWYFDVTKIDGDKALSIIDRMPTRF